MKRSSKMTCPKCGEETRVLSQGNTDMSEWRRDSRGRWAKIKKPSSFQIRFRCRNPKCGNVFRLNGPNKARVLQFVRVWRRVKRVAA